MNRHGGPIGPGLTGVGQGPVAEARAATTAAAARKVAPAVEAAATAAAAAAVAPGVTPGAGFRNFGMDGLAPREAVYSGIVDKPWDTQVMFAKLMRRMAMPHDFGTADDSNPAIPAGYTYLAQFAAHDIIRNTTLQANLAGPENGRRNMRQRSLMLDALYGDGPVFSESLYELPRPGEHFRTMLRTGSIARLSSLPAELAGRCPHLQRDIPRFHQADLSDGGRTRIGRPDVLVPDQRNDDNAVVAQMTALLHHLHNAVAEALRALPAMPLFDPHMPLGFNLFENARRVTTALYRGVLRRDLLNRLLIEHVRDRYEATGFQPIADPRSHGIPLEFSHAAYRLGHAMVRKVYRFNRNSPPKGIRDTLDNRSSSRPHKFPLLMDWIADWSSFFELGYGEVQFSRRIGPSFNSVLLEHSEFPSILIGSGPGGATRPGDEAHLPDPMRSGLLLRDLVRGVAGGLLTLEEMLGRVPAEILEASPLLGSPADALKNWLDDPSIGFTPAELDHLSSNPPLILWLLFEAAHEAKGLSLGTLGSVIVGDVFAAQLAASSGEIETDSRTRTLLRKLFPKGTPDTMPGLIRFTAKILELESVVPIFADRPDNRPTS